MRWCLTGLLAFLLGAVPPLLAQTPAAAMQPGAGARPQRIAEGSVPVPQFTHHDRVGQLSAAFPEIERIVAAFVAQRHIPGAVLGVVVGELVHTTTTGMRKEGMQYFNKNEKYKRPTLWCNSYDKNIIALAHQLGVFKKTDYEFAEAAFEWCKRNLELEIIKMNDVDQTLQRGTGTCIHINSVFAALVDALD